MKRHLPIVAFLFVLTTVAQAQPRPNVVVFVLDDVSTQLATASTSLSALAEEGIQFTAATSPSPLCAPARASILTGLHVHNHGVYGNVGGQEAWDANGNGYTIADYLQAAGYNTARFGKWINDVKRTGQSGWNYSETAQPTVGDPGGVTAMTLNAVQYIQSNQSEPLMLYFAPNHDWQNPDPDYFGLHDDAALPMPPNFNELDVSDKRFRVEPDLLTADEIEQIAIRHKRSLEVMETMVDSIRSIKAAFGSRPVYIFVVSDNGHEDGHHRYFSSKGKHFEESVQVPMFVLGPDLAGRAVTAPVYHLDIAPTLVELAGAASPPMDGRSLMPWLFGQTPLWRAFTMLEHGKNANAFLGMRTPRRKLAVREGAREFYNLKLDPYELRNKCATDETCGSDLLSYVYAMETCRGDECWAIETSLASE